MGGDVKATGPDLVKDGIALSEVAEGAIVAARVNDEAVLVVRCDGKSYAVGAACAHYSAPLADGIVEGSTIRCPWHHARFDLASGAPANPPAINPIACYRVEERGDRLFVLGRADAKRPAVARGPASVAIVGAGAAGCAVADELRRAGFDGAITLIGDDADDPVDRPNLSKDFLAGNAPEEWIPLRSPEHFAEQRVELYRGERVTAIEAGRVLLGAREIAADAIVLATGAEPIRLNIPGADGPNVHVLRTLGDTRRIIARAEKGKRAVVIGAGFIGLETAASLVARGLEVDVVGREDLPLERVLGRELGELVRDVHVAKGTRFHLGTTPAAIDEHGVTLANGTRLPADLVIMGVGVRPSIALAEALGLTIDRGIVVDDQFRTSRAGVWACGDAARYPDARTGEHIRVEHWAVAQRHGLSVARSILGRGEPFRAVPFFWSAHHDVTINYVGHAESWDRIDVAGSVRDRDCLVAYRRGGRTLAVASVGRDRESLRAESAIERGDEGALLALVPGQ